MEYADRLAEAKQYTEAGYQRVLNTPEPEGQKFPRGSRVHINVGSSVGMEHFITDVDATVEYVSAHAYGGDNVKWYRLDIDGYGSTAWYHESQLTAI